MIEEHSSVIFFKCTELNWNRKYANRLCVSIFLNTMRCYLRDIEKIHNYSCVIYTFTGKVKNGTPNIKKKLIIIVGRNHFSPVMIGTAQNNFHF